LLNAHVTAVDEACLCEPFPKATALKRLGGGGGTIQEAHERRRLLCAGGQCSRLVTSGLSR
jgi:hypothetical protein